MNERWRRNNFFHRRRIRFWLNCSCFLVVLAFLLGFHLIVRYIFRDRTPYQTFPECHCRRKFLWPPHPDHRYPYYNSTCSDEGTHYRANQSAISFSLYAPADGDRDGILLQQYQLGLQRNLDAMHDLYPNFTIRVYTNLDLTNGSKHCQLLCLHKDLFWCDTRIGPGADTYSKMNPMTWRFLPLGDPSVDLFMVRDLDSVISDREAAVVHDWLQFKEQKAIHVMRDSPNEGHRIEILGGMWGAKNSLLEGSSELQQEIILASHEGLGKAKGFDQDMLAAILYYPRKEDIVAYDSYHCLRFNETIVKPFLTRRRVLAEKYVGDFVGNKDLGLRIHLFTPCPEECRPSFGKDWEHC